jgi:hypothetical protein
MLNACAWHHLIQLLEKKIRHNLHAPAVPLGPAPPPSSSSSAVGAGPTFHVRPVGSKRKVPFFVEKAKVCDDVF